MTIPETHTHTHVKPNQKHPQPKATYFGTILDVALMFERLGESCWGDVAVYIHSKETVHNLFR